MWPRWSHLTGYVYSYYKVRTVVGPFNHYDKNHAKHGKAWWGSKFMLKRKPMNLINGIRYHPQLSMCKFNENRKLHSSNLALKLSDFRFIILISFSNDAGAHHCWNATDEIRTISIIVLAVIVRLTAIWGIHVPFSIESNERATCSSENSIVSIIS